MKKSQLFTLAAVLAASAAMTGCSSEQQMEDVTARQQLKGETYRAVITVTKPGFDNTTRTITQDGNALVTSWLAGEKVYAYVGDDAATELAYSVTDADIDQENNQKATLHMNFTKEGGFQTGDQIMLYYLKPKAGYDDYSGQKGTLADIAQNFDRMKTAIVVTAVIPGTDSDNLLATTTANFARRQAITKFTIKKKSGESVEDLNVKANEPLNIKYNDVTVDVTPESNTNEIYVALPATGSETAYRFESTGEDTKKYGSSKDVNLVNGSYYTATLQMGRDAGKMELSLPDEGAGSYTGEPYSIFPIKDAEGNELEEGTHYDVEYKKKDPDTGEWQTVTKDDVTDAGEYKIEVTGKDPYDGTLTKEFTVEMTPVEEVQAAITAGTIASGTKISQGTDTKIIPESTTILGLTAAEIKAGEKEPGSSITTGTLTPTGTWATVNAAGELVTTGGGVVEVVITLPETANHKGASVTKTIYVKQSGTSADLPDPTTAP